MRGLSATRILLLATAAVSLGWGQVPTISTLQSSRINNQPSDVTGITSGTASLADGFTLYINGTFHLGSVSVQWFNTSTNVATSFEPASLQISATQIIVPIPFSLFQALVAAPVAVTVTVTETGGASSATFTINPPLQAIGPILPSGTINQPYSAYLITGGTPPFDAGVPTAGALPTGVTPIYPSVTLTGTPTLTGVFNFQTQTTDFWGNNVNGDDTIEIVRVPTLTSLSPNSSGTGAGSLTLTVTGTNFVAPVPVGTQQIPGSQVQWVGSVVTPLVTTWNSANQLTAVVPSALLSTLAFAGIVVVQPSNVSSNALPFSVGSPSISAIVPASVPVGSSATTVIVNGANFVVNAASASLSTVSLNGVALTTVLVNSGTLTAAVPAGMLISPAGYNVQVTNPLGRVSNTVQFSVLAPGISSLSTASVPAGSPAFGLTVTGVNYLSGSQVSFRGTTLATTFVNGTTLIINVPASLIATSGPVNVQVINPGGALSNTQPFTVGAPTLGAISPTSIPAGSPAFTLAVTGASFVSGSQVSFNGTVLTTTFNTSTALTAAVPATLVAGPKAASIVVTNPGGSVSGASSFTVIGSLAITTTSLYPGTAGSIYSANLTGRGGTPPYTWAASGLPSALSVNPATGVLSGVLPAGGTYLVTVVLQDAARSTANAQFPLVVGLPPVSIAPSSSLPSGFVGAAYAGFIFANGGSELYTFSLGGGKLPDGLTLSSGGMVSGTPKTPGQFPFSVGVADSTGMTASREFSILVQTAPLNITGGPTTSVSIGAPVGISFVGTGGVAPYRFTFVANLPPGTTFANGVLSGTPTTAGAFTFRVTMADSTGAVVSLDFTLTVEAPSKLSLSGSLSGGKAGAPYTSQISASGGTGPYSYAGSGLPDGLSLSASGSVSGTPGTAGQFSFTATVTDSKGATASGTFPITIAPADLGIVTASLPDGVVGVVYSANLAASGGVKPYTWTVVGLPDGVTATAAGAVSGTPTRAGKFTAIVSVTDAATTSVTVATRSYSGTVAPAQFAITTASLPNGTAGTAYSASVAASGGAAPFTFSATGLPSGLSMSAAGSISGTPTAPGAATIVVTVTDAAGVRTSKTFPVTIGLPSAPPLSLAIAGISDTAGPLQQPRLQVTLGNSFPVDVVVSLTLAFTPDTGADDPTIQFSGGGRTARITVPAGATNGATDAGVQTGSVAGLIAITAQMQGAGQDVTPSPAPRRTIRIAAAAPVIVPGTLTAVRNSSGFTITLTGYATDRELTQAIFQFTAAAGSNLQTTTLTLPIDALFAPYFSGAAATPFGSQFTYTQPFTVTGNLQVVASVTVTLVNKIGQSAPATAAVN